MKVELSFDGDRLTAVNLPARPPSDLTSDALLHLAAALAARPLQFPPTASAFRRRVWEAIRQIPFGQTVTYQELAAQIGSPGAARAVGGACAANRLLLAVPCHRVVVEGDGVVGKTPRLHPGERFSYHSYHVIASDSVAEGAFFALNEAGERVATRIPRFEMKVPKRDV